MGDRITIADIGLAAMMTPLAHASADVRDDPAVAGLLRWSRGILTLRQA
jgi:hypothetical protein